MNKKVFTLTLSILFLTLGTNSRAEETQSETFSYNDLYAGELSVMGTMTKLPNFSQWHYFAFDEEEGVILKGTSDFDLGTLTGGIGSEVINTTWQERTDWDIAFHAYDIRTNSGIAGNGNAGAVFIADETSATANGKTLDEIYADLTEAPDVEYTTDTEIIGVYYLSLTAGMPPHRTTNLSVSPATRKADNGASADFVTYAMTGASENPMIVVFKTTGGKYVKTYLKQFIGDDGEPGHLVINHEFIPLEGTSGLDNNSEIKFGIYPNPATEILNVEVAEPTTIVIYNLNGSVVKQEQANTGINSISVSNLSAGVYFVKASNQTQKLIVR